MFEKVRKLTENCSCGKHHSLLTDEFVISERAGELMWDYIKKNGFNNPAIICDDNTAGFLGLPNRLTVPGNAHATEIYAGIAEKYVDENHPDVLIACGSGSVHDVTRYAAHSKNVPFISFPTAASVDGYLSSVAAMTWYGQKLTFEAAPPIAVFADPEVYCTAPDRLTSSGVGDVLGKYNSLFDWKAAKILIGEYFCGEICSLEYDAVEELIQAVKSRANLDKKDYTTKVMYALLLSGLAMQLAGNSRPASGAEHHMSHFWEMHCINPETDALHGEKVAVGLLEVVREYKRVFSSFSDGYIAEKIKKINLDKTFSECKITTVYGNLADSTMKENLPDGTMSSSSLAKISMDDSLKDKIHEIRALADELPSVDELTELYKAAGVPMTPADVGLPDEFGFIGKSLEYAPYVRNRITLLKVLSAAEIVNRPADRALVVILGPHAVGKMTVGQHLASLTGLKLFHNHMSIELVRKFFNVNDNGVGTRLNRLIRSEIFKGVAESEDIRGLIFTYMFDFDEQSEYDYVNNLIDLYKFHGAKCCVVELCADFDVRIERNKSEKRLLNKESKRDIEKSEAEMRRTSECHRLNSNEGEMMPFENYMKIDNTNIPPEKAAEMIRDYFNL